MIISGGTDLLADFMPTTGDGASDGMPGTTGAIMILSGVHHFTTTGDGTMPGEEGMVITMELPDTIAMVTDIIPEEA